MNESSAIFKIADERVEVHPNEAVVADGVEIGAPPIEIDLAASLAAQPDVPKRYDDICQEVWGSATPQSYATVRVHMGRLRGRLGEELGDRKTGAFITRPRIGYCALSSLNARQEVKDSEGVLFIADRRIALDPEKLIIIRDGESLVLADTPFKILMTLASQPDVPVLDDNLLRSIWGASDKSTHDSARVHINEIRRQLGAELGHPRSGAVRRRQRIGYYAVSSLVG